MPISVSMVDWGRFTDSQRDALTGLGLGDRGAALRRCNGKTRSSLTRRGMIEQRPHPLPVGVRLTPEGQATVVARGWVPELVLREDDHAAQPEEQRGSEFMCRRCGLAVYPWRGDVWKHAGGGEAISCRRTPDVVERRAWEAELHRDAVAAVEVIRRRSSWYSAAGEEG